MIAPPGIHGVLVTIAGLRRRLARGAGRDGVDGTIVLGMNEDFDAVIAAHLAAGELAAAATAALERLGPQILGYLAATLRDDDAAYEVFGHFSEQLWKSIATFRGESSFKTWTYKLVMHSISRFRRDGFRRGTG